MRVLITLQPDVARDDDAVRRFADRLKAEFDASLSHERLLRFGVVSASVAPIHLPAIRLLQGVASVEETGEKHATT